MNYNNSERTTHSLYIRIEEIFLYSKDICDNYYYSSDLNLIFIVSKINIAEKLWYDVGEKCPFNQEVDETRNILLAKVRVLMS